MPRDVHSYSSLATLASCAEKFRLAYVEEIEPPGVNLPQVAGTAFDAALNRLYVSGWDEAEAIAALEAAWGDIRPPLGAKHGHLTLDFLRERVRTYMREREARPTLMETGEVLTGFSGVMHAFEWADAAGRVVRVRGIPDFAIRDTSGRIFVVDLKTTSAWISDWWMTQFRIGHQLRIYAAMVETLTGEQVAGGLINAVYVGEKALDPPEAWTRRKSAPSRLERIDITRGQIEEAHEWVRGVLALERMCEAEDLWPRNERACGDYGGCEFLDLCTAPSAMVRKARMMTAFRRKTSREEAA